MLDDPSLSLAPLIVKEIFHIVSALRGTGVATLLIEQNARAALQISDMATCWKPVSSRSKGGRLSWHGIHR